jgi:hypothetical protein
MEVSVQNMQLSTGISWKFPSQVLLERLRAFGCRVVIAARSTEGLHDDPSEVPGSSTPPPR